MQSVIFQDLGLVDYKKAWDYQEKLLQKLVQNKITHREAPVAPEHYLLFCEHPPVFTLGKSGNEKNLLLNSALLEKKNIQYYSINRGGDITFHGPGQLVVYPIFDLDWFFTDIHKYLRLLEQAVINILKKYGITGERSEKLTGVWIKGHTERKICAIGVRCSRWVTMHGLAFNINTDLNYFNYIIPCGIQNKAVTSMQQELGHEVNMDDIKNLMQKELSALFEFTITEHELVSL